MSAHLYIDRIHCDLWEPSPVSYTQGFRFYAIFVDDCTRFSWLYPLHNKAEFFELFTTFVKLVENRFDTTIKEFQSDGGGEFVNHHMKKFLADKGIQHKISCPYTPEQNGLAERKHRHCVELDLSMMFHSHLPLHLWVEAFSTANHIINLLPSVILKDKSPFEMLITPSRCMKFFEHLAQCASPVYVPCNPINWNLSLLSVFSWVIVISIKDIGVYILPMEKCIYHDMSYSMKNVFHSRIITNIWCLGMRQICSRHGNLQQQHNPSLK